MIRVVIEAHCSAPGCDRYTRATARLVQAVDLEWHDVEFPTWNREPSEWRHGMGGVRCPEHAPQTQKLPPA